METETGRHKNLRTTELDVRKRYRAMAAIMKWEAWKTRETGGK